MAKLSMLANGPHLCLTVDRPAVTAVCFTKQRSSRWGVWCYLNDIVLSWHITRGAEL